jgi:hypothetical protein
LLRAAELVVRTSCVGEALTIPILKLARSLAGSPLVAAALQQIIEDESSHAQLGWWFLDWAAPRLDDRARQHLGEIAAAAIRSFAPLLGGGCQHSGLGAVACERYGPAFADAVARVARAEARDSITLWRLSRTSPDDRAAVFARLDQLSRRPAEVGADDVLAGNPDAIERWRQALDATWSCVGCGPPTQRKR